MSVNAFHMLVMVALTVMVISSIIELWRRGRGGDDA